VLGARGGSAPRRLILALRLRPVENLTSFEWPRPATGIAGAKLSEHGKANALDIHSLRACQRKGWWNSADPHVPKDIREDLRKKALVRDSQLSWGLARMEAP